MDKNTDVIIRKRIDRVMENLRKNNMEPFFVEKVSGVVPLVESLINEGDTVTVGGSQSLFEGGVIDLLRSGKYNFLDRSREGITSEEVQEIYRKAFYADAYLCSSNAVTESGELYNVDGNSNRVAAILFGPKSVIIVVGYNKIVKDIDEAVRRVKAMAAPANCVRLDCDTYCFQKGECMGLEGYIADGCRSEGRICCNYVISARQRIKGRIKVIIVGEPLGY